MDLFFFFNFISGICVQIVFTFYNLSEVEHESHPSTKFTKFKWRIFILFMYAIYLRVIIKFIYQIEYTLETLNSYLIDSHTIIYYECYCCIPSTVVVIILFHVTHTNFLTPYRVLATLSTNLIINVDKMHPIIIGNM